MPYDIKQLYFFQDNIFNHAEYQRARRYSNKNTFSGWKSRKMRNLRILSYYFEGWIPSSISLRLVWRIYCIYQNSQIIRRSTYTWNWFIILTAIICTYNLIIISNNNENNHNKHLWVLFVFDIWRLGYCDDMGYNYSFDWLIAVMSPQSPVFYLSFRSNICTHSTLSWPILTCYKG